MEIIRFSIPLNEESKIMSAALLTITPTMLIPDIMLIALTDFFENKYLLAKRYGKFIVISL
ncbi:hypothetical protein D3C86_1919090 [compost metagenome]